MHNTSRKKKINHRDTEDTEKKLEGEKKLLNSDF